MTIEKYILLNLIRTDECHEMANCYYTFIAGTKSFYHNHYKCPLYLKPCQPMITEYGTRYMLKPTNIRQVAAEVFINFYGTEEELFDVCL